MIRTVRNVWDVYAGKRNFSQGYLQETIGRALAVSETAPGTLADAIAQFIKVHYLEQQEILEMANGVERLDLVKTLLQREIEK